LEAGSRSELAKKLDPDQEIQEIKRLKTKPWRAVDAQNGGVDLHHFDEEQDPDPNPH
jgi:hypothetical protein